MLDLLPNMPMVYPNYGIAVDTGGSIFWIQTVFYALFISSVVSIKIFSANRAFWKGLFAFYSIGFVMSGSVLFFFMFGIIGFNFIESFYLLSRTIFSFNTVVFITIFTLVVYWYLQNHKQLQH